MFTRVVVQLKGEREMIIYSTLDLKLKQFGQPYLMPNDDVLRRAMADELPGTKSPVALHPEDYAVYAVGEFDADTGVIEAYAPPVLVDAVSVILQGR